ASADRAARDHRGALARAEARGRLLDLLVRRGLEPLGEGQVVEAELRAARAGDRQDARVAPARQRISIVQAEEEAVALARRGEVVGRERSRKRRGHLPAEARGGLLGGLHRLTRAGDEERLGL